MDWNRIPPLQKEIIKLLAIEGLLTKNEVAEKLQKSYKNVIFAFNSLENKKLIKPIGEKIYRNQKFTTYWLNWLGIARAYMLGASIKKLKAHTYAIYKDKLNETNINHVKTFFRLLENLEKEDITLIFNCFDFSVNPPKLKTIPLFLVTNPEKTIKLFKVLTKYEPYKTKGKELLKIFLEALK